MVIRDGASSFEITLREAGPPGTPAEGDVGVNVAATTPATGVGGPFAGRNDSVWIGRDDWAAFMEDLRELERTRRGKAHVRAVAPAELELTVSATDRAGHMAAEGWVGREYAGRNGDFHDRVCFRIEIDPSTLPHIVRELEGISLDG
jgi:hypothetical protein